MNQAAVPLLVAAPLMGGLTILRAHQGRATKIHTATEGGWKTQGYDRLYRFSGETLEVNDLGELMTALTAASADPKAIVVGEVLKPGQNPRDLLRRIHGRDAGLVPALDGVRWICWEVDKVADLPGWFDPTSPDRGGDVELARWWIRQHLPPQFHDRSAILQWSASALVSGKVSFHLWQWLDRPVSRASVKAYAMAHWRARMDCTIWDGARVHYVADPIFRGEDGAPLPDPLAGSRWQWVDGQGGDTCEALPEWVDECGWSDFLGREWAKAEAAKLDAAARRAELAATLKMPTTSSTTSSTATDDETKQLLDPHLLPLRDLDPKRVLAWAKKAMRSQAAKIHEAVAGDAVVGRHQFIREAGFIAGNILEGLDHLGAALSPETQQRVSWASEVTAVEDLVNDIEDAAVKVGGDDPDRARVLHWAVDIGRTTPVLPDYRLPMKWRAAAQDAKAAKATEATEAAQKAPAKGLPAYKEQPATGGLADLIMRIAFDGANGETGEVFKGGAEAQAAPYAWKKGLKYKEDGGLRKCDHNLLLILGNDPRVGQWRFNRLAQRVDLHGAPAWGRDPEAAPQVEETDILALKAWLQSEWDYYIGKDSLRDIVSLHAIRHAYDPLRDYLRGLKWDGVERIFSWARDLLGAPDDEATRLAGAWWLMTAAERALNPGCQADYVITFEGAQGVGKSSILAALCPEVEWTATLVHDVSNPRAVESIRGKWLVCLDELAVASHRKDMRLVRSFVTARADDYRAAYAHYPKQYLRRCAFVATVNPSASGTYLEDDENRRWWPIRCARHMDVSRVAEARDQLWAEAVALLDQGVRHFPTKEEQDTIFAPEQKKRREEDVWTPIVHAYVLKARDVTTLGVLTNAIGFDKERITSGHSRQVAAILRELGWDATQGAEEGQVIDGAPVHGRSLTKAVRWWRAPKDSEADEAAFEVDEETGEVVD